MEAMNEEEDTAMDFLGLELPVKNHPELDPGFVPLGKFFSEYRRGAARPFALALEREGGQVAVFEAALRGESGLTEADRCYVDRLAKLLLWVKGGWKFTVCGCPEAGEYLRTAYAPGGSRDFDRGFMERIYERPFTVELCAYADRPAAKEGSAPVGRHTGGCRIGLDVGASNIKISALRDGETVFSESRPWRPKTEPDVDYHYAHLTDALKTAAGHLPKVDGVGVSSAGVFVGGRCMVASLFLAVEQRDFDRRVKNIYTETAKVLGEAVHVAVANDGDVTALAGAMALDRNGILGISMGTSQAGGYVDRSGNVMGWLNELAFVPMDVQKDAAWDEWSGDLGCGVKYLSQDGGVKLAEWAGISLPDGAPADKFAEVRRLMDGGDERAIRVYHSLGVYLGHAVALYSQFYDINLALIMGGVAGGPGGDILLADAARVLREDYPELTFPVEAPDTRVRQLGQSVAAASLPL